MKFPCAHEAASYGIAMNRKFEYKKTVVRQTLKRTEHVLLISSQANGMRGRRGDDPKECSR